MAIFFLGLLLAFLYLYVSLHSKNKDTIKYGWFFWNSQDD